MGCSLIIGSSGGPASQDLSKEIADQSVKFRRLLEIGGVGRPRNHFQPGALGLVHESGQEVRSVPVTPLAISASDLRHRVRRGASIRYLVP
ncbi:MAG: hypothetical protein ACE5Q6_06235, partial [Dehalococcoidia bacterium]